MRASLAYSDLSNVVYIPITTYHFTAGGNAASTTAHSARSNLAGLPRMVKFAFVVFAEKVTVRGCLISRCW